MPNNNDFEIDTLAIAKDYAHIFLSFSQRYSIAQAVGMLKSISAKVMFKEHPEVKKEFWGGELWGKRIFCAHRWGLGNGRGH